MGKGREEYEVLPRCSLDRGSAGILRGIGW